jgi:hypothetical protein
MISGQGYVNLYYNDNYEQYIKNQQMINKTQYTNIINFIKKIICKINKM